MPVSSIAMLDAAAKRFDDDKKSVAAAVIKQLLHIATDLYTPCGIQLPGASLVLSNTSVETLTQYISTGDLIKTGASAGLAVLINTIISAVHGCQLLSMDYGSNFALETYQARTKKILLYSNMIASSSNILQTAFTQNINNLDLGGLLVTVYRLFSDIKFICKLEYEYLNCEISKVYEDKLAAIEDFYM